MKFPNMMYRCPGAHHCPGGTYDYLSVQNVDDVAEATREGWWPTIELAQSKPDNYDFKKVDGKKLFMAHKGRGRYDVIDEDGKVILNNVSKNEAEASGAVKV